MPSTDQALLCSVYRELGSSLESKRSYLQKRLNTIGFKTLQTQGSYFLVADFRRAWWPGCSFLLCVGHHWCPCPIHVWSCVTCCLGSIRAARHEFPDFAEP